MGKNILNEETLSLSENSQVKKEILKDVATPIEKIYL